MVWAGLRGLRPPAAGWCNELVLSAASGLIFTMFCPGHWAPGPSLASINNTLTQSPPLSQISAMKGFYSRSSRSTRILKSNPPVICINFPKWHFSSAECCLQQKKWAVTGAGAQLPSSSSSGEGWSIRIFKLGAAAAWVTREQQPVWSWVLGITFVVRN